MPAYTPGFTHDVFISYAHANNIPLTPGDDGWITKFHLALEQFLVSELGRGEYFSIWRDKKLQGLDDFGEMIEATLCKSAVLISIYSQGYVESEWCRKELKLFCQQKPSPFGLKIGEKFRFIRVELGAIREPNTEIPEDFVNRALGYQFYEIKDEIDKPFRRTSADDADQRYWDVMRRLARDIAQLLKQMKKMSQPQQVASSGPTVYLAEAADDLEEHRNLVKTALEQKGVRVVPEFPLSLGDSELALTIRRYIKEAMLTVHLVGQYPGKTPAKQTRPVVHLQYDLATEIAREKSLPRLIWHPNNLNPGEISKEEHRKFLESLDGAPGASDEILRASLEELKEIILVRVFPPVVKSELADEEEHDRLIYLSYLPSDKDEALKVKELLRREKFDVTSFRYEDRDPRLLERMHRASLDKSDGVVIFYGADDLWAFDRAMEAREVARERKKKQPLKAMCICDGPPEDKPRELEVDFKRLFVANCRDGVDPEDLKDFVEAIKD
jgi:hypothetical protein